MSTEDLQRRLLETFLAELDEHVASLNGGLLALERQAPRTERAALVVSLFRAAHSLKGAARAVDVRPIERAAHGLEGLLAEVRDGRSLTPDLLARLFAVVDAVEEAGERLRRGETLPEAALAAAVSKLEAARGGDAGGATSVPPEEEKTEPPGAVPDASPPPPIESVPVAATKLDVLAARSAELASASRKLAADLAELPSFLPGDGRRHGAGGSPVVPRLPAASERRRRAPSPAGRAVRPELERRLRRLAEAARALARDAAAVEDEARRLQMLPFGLACRGLDRMVRDLVAGRDKRVELVVEGEEIELERSVLDGLRDPLRHLVRNAVDHGVEPLGARRGAGKRPTGRIVLRAALLADAVEIVVEDDGRGVDREALRRRAAALGHPVPRDDGALLRLLFRPGITTRSEIDEISGRGVGLDAVRARLAALRGTVAIDSEEGRGTRVVLTVPVALSAMRLLFVGNGGQVVALPSAVVRRVLRLESTAAPGRVVVDGRAAPVATLAAALGRGGGAAGGRGPAVALAAEEGAVVLRVDELVAEAHALVHALPPRLRGAPGVVGTTVLPDGRVAFLLDVPFLVGAASSSPKRPAGTHERRRTRVLLAEDSVTTRGLVKGLLEAAGYEVVAAGDGAEAWERLERDGADILVTDIEMPGLDGLSLTRRVRGSPRYADLPVIVVTALDTEAHRQGAERAGASAYLPKSAFDQGRLVDAIERLLSAEA